MSIRCTLTFTFFSSIIVLCHATLKVTKNEYHTDWECDSLCNNHLAGQTTHSDQACSIFKGTQDGCVQRKVYLYVNESDSEGYFEEHYVLKCNASDGIKYLTSGAMNNEYLEWYSGSENKLYPSGFVTYIPEDPFE